jgi:hypothetical protein
MSPYRIARLAAEKLFRWEFAWVAVEVLGVAIGLWLMLGIKRYVAGGGALFLVCGMSFFIRGRQYVGIVRRS